MDSNDLSIPEGWWLVQKTNAQGIFVKYYTNEIGQRFDTKEALLHYVNYAKKDQVSIYAPDYVSPKARKSRKRKSRNSTANPEASGSTSQNDSKE